MAKLPPPQNDIVTAIYDYHKSSQKEEHRPHLGGSLIGDECSRKLFYTFRWCNAPKFDGRMLRLFETGFLEEDRFIKELRAIGCQVWEVDPDTGQQIRIEDCGGHFSGSLDGIVMNLIGAPRTAHVLEMKTHNAKSFVELQMSGVEKAKPQHYAQMQVYGYKMKLTRALYLAKNKNDDEVYAERLHIIPEVGKLLIEKASRIIFTDTPPAKISEDAAFYKCKFCDHSALCHGAKPPETNCRTCAFSTAKVNGGWRCEHRNKDISTQEQREGCDKHLFNPAIMPIKARVFDPTVHVMEYENGLQNGARGISKAIPSKELSTLDNINIANDKDMVEMMSKFDGKFIE